MFKIVFLFSLIFFSYTNTNASEIEYVQICVDPNWAPVEFIDKDGAYIGIVPDILKLIEKKTNFIFTLVPTKTWDESLNFIKEKKCDVIPLISYDQNRNHLLFTKIYLEYPEALLVMANENKKTLEEIIKLPIGVTKGYSEIEWFKNKYPSINIIEVENMKDGIDKIRHKEIYGYINTLPILGYHLKKKGILDLKISQTFEDIGYTLEGRMGVRKDKIKLYDKLTKAIDDLKQDELDEILEKWAGVDINDILIDYTFAINILAIILAIILVITLLVLYLNYKLNLLVMQKTKKLKEFADTLEDQVKEKTKEIRYLLDNVGQGFLALSKDFFINSEYSKECENLLGTNIANEDIDNILFSDKDESDRLRFNCGLILKMSNEDTRIFAIALLPKETTIKEKTISIEYRIIDDRFMLILTDISEHKKLENKIKNEQNILKMIVSIIKDNDIFYDLKNDFDYFVKNIENFIDENDTVLDSAKNIYNKIHTFKGLFLQLFMNNTALQLHDIESKLYDILDNDKNITNKFLLQFLKEANFRTFMESDLNNIVEVLGENFINRDKFVSVDKLSLEDIEEKCMSLVEIYNENKLIVSMLESIRILSIKSLKSYLDAYARLIFQMSQVLKKPIYEFESIGDENILLPVKCINFMQSLNHVFRNALTHGIETKNTRHSLGKDGIGQVSCSFSQENNNLKIIISDDGCGIDVEKIRKKVGNNNLSKEETYSYIFKDSFSTKDKVNQFVGRGIGLSAVKMEIDKLGGHIEVISEINNGTKFIFTISLGNLY